MSSSRSLAVVFAILLSGFCAGDGALHATTLVPAGIVQLAREAPLIVLGTVDRVEPVRSLTNGRVQRRVVIATERVAKGTARDEISVVVPGGTLGRYRTVFTGSPEFVAGEQVVLFLARRADGEWRILGLSQGVFRVAGLAAGRVVIPPPVVRIAAGSGGTARVTRGGQSGRVVMVDEFLDEITRSLATRPPAGGRVP